MRYPKHEKDVNVILDLARAARRVEEHFGAPPAADIIQHIDNHAAGWALSLIEIVLEYEDRRQQHALLWARWKRWRSNLSLFAKHPARAY